MFKKHRTTRIAGVLGAAALAITFNTGTATEANAVDFSGKRIRVIVPFNEGGGTDSLSRLLQPFFERHLPGNPKILVINKPGAGGIVGGNYFETRAPKDGTWVLAMSTSTVMNFVLGDPRVKFDIAKWPAIALLPRGNVIYARSELGLKGLAPKELVTKLQSFPREALVFGGKTPTASAINKRMSLSMIGVEVKDVWGMKGNGPMALAFERGEFTINFDNSLSYMNNRKHFREAGIATEVFTLGAPNAEGDFKNADGSWNRDPTYPEVPTIMELYEASTGKKFSGPAAEGTLGLIQAGVSANKSYHLPTGTADPVLEAWRKAFAAAMKDPDFVKKQDKIIGKYNVLVGAAAGKAIKDATALSSVQKAFIKDYVKKRYNLDLKI